MRKFCLYTSLTCALFLASGCATANIKMSDTPGMQTLERRAAESLTSTPSVVKVKLPKNAFQVTSSLHPIPANVDTLLNVDFANASIEEVLYTISKTSGINIIQNAATTDKSKTAVTSPVTISFNGKLSDFLSTLSRLTGYGFDYFNGSVIVQPTQIYAVTVPGYQKILEEVEKNLKTLGASNISYDRFTSTLTFTSDANAEVRIQKLCDEIRNNATLVTLRIMLLDVYLQDTKNTGIDWSQFAIGYGSQRSTLPFGQHVENLTSSTTSSTTVSALQSGAAAVLNTTGANLYLEAANFSMSLLLNFLNTYGDYKITQNAFVEAMSGSQGKFNVLTETPYVSEISFSALSSQITTPTQAVKTATAKAGVEMTILPTYSHQDGTMTIALKVDILGVTRMITLSAGSQIGNITQPETTKKSIDTFLRMTPEQVAVIGGLVFEQETGNQSGFPIESVLTQSASKSKQKEELVLVVKPTIIEFE